MEYSLKYLSYEKGYLVNALEAVLFASGDAVEKEKLARLFEITLFELDETADMLSERLNLKDSSFELCRLGDSLQLCTKTAYAPHVKKFLEIKRTAPISRAALEALAVVAYKQPVSKGYIEKVRGVDCTAIVNTLIQRELIEECGRLDAPGRPILYRTTNNFLRCFGLNSLEDLPGDNSVQLSIDQVRTDENIKSAEE